MLGDVIFIISLLPLAFEALRIVAEVRAGIETERDPDMEKGT